MSEFLDEMESEVPALRRYARALTGSREAADDLVQDCLERAIRKRGLFVRSGPLRSWLFTLMLNLFRNAERARKRRPVAAPIEDVPGEPQVAPAQHGRLLLAEMARAIASLPLDQREALLLVALEGLSYADAARILNIPQGTLMSRIARARSALRALTGEAEEPRLRTVK